MCTDEKKWWKRVGRANDKENPWAREPNSVDIEMTAYALLTYLQRELVEDALPILHWLISQQNEQGGFASSQVSRFSPAAYTAAVRRTVPRRNVFIATDWINFFPALVVLGYRGHVVRAFPDGPKSYCELE